MAFTDNCDIFLDINEAALNRVVRHFMRQRPSTFNIGSPALVANPSRACARIDAHPVVLARGNPLIGLGPDLPVAGTNFLVEYVLQLAAAEVDVSPGKCSLCRPSSRRSATRASARTRESAPGWDARRRRSSTSSATEPPST